MILIIHPTNIYQVLTVCRYCAFLIEKLGCWGCVKDCGNTVKEILVSAPLGFIIELALLSFVLLASRQASKWRDEWVGQGVATLFGNPAA